MALLDEIQREFETAVSTYAVTGKTVLTERTHVDTGLLRRSLRVRTKREGLTLVAEVIMQDYGVFLNNKAPFIRKTPPGPRSDGWIDELSKRATSDVARNFDIAQVLELALARSINTT